MPLRKILQPLIFPVGFMVQYGFTYLVRIQTQLTVQTVGRFLDYFAMACRAVLLDRQAQVSTVFNLSNFGKNLLKLDLPKRKRSLTFFIFAA